MSRDCQKFWVTQWWTFRLKPSPGLNLGVNAVLRPGCLPEMKGVCESLGIWSKIKASGFTLFHCPIDGRLPITHDCSVCRLFAAKPPQADTGCSFPHLWRHR
jgi:hypothetical protein